jgi:hypothetical protein
MRIIDHSNCPSNVRTFTANSFDEAVLKADRLIREDGVQAVVWLRKEFTAAVSCDDLAYLGKCVNKIIPRLSDPKERFDVKVVSTLDGNAVYKLDLPLLKACIEDEMLKTLATKFTRSAAKIRVMNRSYSDAHYDPVEENYSFSEEFLFYGLPIKILEYHGFLGTMIYDPSEMHLGYYQEYTKFKDDKYSLREWIGHLILPNPWHVRGSDMLFLTNKGWPDCKVALHGEPEYEGISPRVVSIYDAGHYRTEMAMEA